MNIAFISATGRGYTEINADSYQIHPGLSAVPNSSDEIALKPASR